MKISAILTLLLSWSFVSSNPHREKSNDKSAGELNYANEHEPNHLNPNEASSGKDWGGIILNTFGQKKNMEAFAEHSMNHIKHIESALETKELAFVDERTKKHGIRSKRHSNISGLPWSNPRYHKGGVSEHILKLSEGSKSNVLKSEKATIAEALNGRAAIQKILARAKAKAAKAARHKMLYDNEYDFSKWLLSGSSFDMDLFDQPFHRSSYDVKVAGRDGIENADGSRHHSLFVPYRASAGSIGHRRNHDRKHTFNAPSARIDTADTEHSYRRLKQREPELWITSEETRGRGTDGIFRKPTRRAHESLFDESAETDGPRRASSRARASRMRHRMTAGSDTPIWRYAGSRKASDRHFRARPSHRLRAARLHRFETSREREEYDKEFAFRTRSDAGRFGLDESEEMDDEWIRARHRTGHRGIHGYGGRKHSDDPDDDTEIIEDSRENAALARKRYHYDLGDQERSIYGEADATTFDNTRNRHFTDSTDEHSSSFDSHYEKDIRNRNSSHDGVERSIIYSRSAEAGVDGVEKEQLDDSLKAGISTGTRKAVSSDDIEHRHSRNQNFAADAAASFSSSLYEEKGSKHTNNAYALPSVDDGSAAVGRKAEDDYNVRGRSHAVINNDATSAGIEMGFSGIKSHPSNDSSSAHSTPPRAHPETHQEHWENRRVVNGYQNSITDTVTSSKTENSTDEDERLKLTKTQETSSTEERDKSNDRVAKKNQEVSESVASSTETTNNVLRSEHRYDSYDDAYDLPRTSSSDEPRNGHHAESRKRHGKLRGNRRTIPRHKTSIEVIDIGDRSAEVYIREFPFYKSRGRKRAPHDIYHYDFNSGETRDEREDRYDESVEDPKRSEVDYDGLEKDDEFVDDDEMFERLMTVLNERRFHGRHRKRGKHDRRKHHGKHTRHNEYSHRAFNQYARDMTSSNTWNASKFKTWDEYLYFIRQQRKNNGTSASFESVASADRKDGRQNNATNEENLSLDERTRMYTTDDDNYVHEKGYKKLPVRGIERIKMKDAPELVQNARSTETDRETKGIDESIEDYWEGEVESDSDTSDRKKNRTRVTHTVDLIYDDSTVDTTARASSDRSAINNGDRHEQGSSNSLLEGSRAGVRTKNVHDEKVHGENENVDIATKQTAETVESNDSKYDQHVSTKIYSMSRSHTESQTENERYAKSRHFKKIIGETQESDEKVSSDSEEKEYRDDDSYKASMSSKSIDESQAETKNYKWKKSRNGHEINSSVETSAEAASSTDTMSRSRSAARDTIASSKSFAKSQIGKSKHRSDNSNKKYNAEAEASADATVSINSGEGFVTANSLSSKSFIEKSKRGDIDIGDYSNDLRNTLTVNLEAASGESHQASTSVQSSVLSKARNEQYLEDSRNVRLSADAETLSTSMASSKVKHKQSTSSSNLSEESRVKMDSNSYGDSQVNAVSQSSTTERLSNITKDEHRSDTQKSFSSSSSESSEAQRAEYQNDFNSLQNNRWNIASAESAIKSEFDNTESRDWSDPSKSSSSSKSAKIHARSKYDTDNSIETQINGIERRAELKSASSSEIHAESRTESEDRASVTENNERNIVNSETSSDATSSVQIKNKHRSKLQNTSLISESSAESQTKDEHYSDNRKMNDKQNIDIKSKMKAASTSIVKNRQQELTSSSSLSRMSTKSQKENENVETTTLNAISGTIVNDINDKKRHNLSYGLLSLQTADEEIKKARKIAAQTITNTATSISTDVHDENYKHENHILNTKCLADPVSKNDVEKLTNNKITEKSKMFKEDLKDELNAVSASTETTSIDVKNTRDLTVLSIDSEAERSVYDTNQQKKEGAISDNSAISRSSAILGASNAIENIGEGKSLETSFLSDLRSTSEKRKAHDMNIIQDNKESMTTALKSIDLNSNEQSRSDLRTIEALKEVQQRRNEFNVSKDNSEDTVSGTMMNTISSQHRVSSAHRDNIDVSSTSYEQIDDKLTDKNSENAGDSIKSSESTIFRNIKHKYKNSSLNSKSFYNSHARTKSEINTRTEMKSLKDTNNVNKIVSTKSAVFNNLNSENQNDPLKVTSSDINSYAATSQKNGYKPDIFSDGDEIADIRDGKRTRGIISQNVIFLSDSRDKAHTKHEDNYNISNELIAVEDKKDSKEDNVREIAAELRKKNEIVSTGIRNNINEWQKELRKTSLSSSYSESQEKKDAIEMEVSNNINKYEHENDPMREKLIASSTNVYAGKENNYDDQRANVGNIEKTRTSEARISNSNISTNEFQYDMKEEVATAMRLKQHDRSFQKEDKLITSTASSTDETNGGEMWNERQHLSGTASFNSHTKMRHKNISNDLKENSKVASSTATSMQTTFSGKVKHGSRGKFTEDPSKSNSYPKSETDNQDNVNILRGWRIVENDETSVDSATSNDLKHVLRYDSTKKNSLSHSSRDTHAEDASRYTLKNNLANDADVIASVKGTSYDDSRDEYQNKLTTTTSLSNSRTVTETEHENNPNIQPRSMGMTSSSMKDRTIEDKNIVNNVGASSKIASKAVASAQTISSGNVENIIKHDTSETLSSLDSYIESQMDYRQSLNIVRNNQQATDIETLSASADNQEERKNNNFKLHSDSQKINKIENDGTVSRKNVHSAADMSGQTAGFNNFEIGHRNNLLKTITWDDPFANTQTENDASVLQKQHSVAMNSMVSSDRLRTVDYIDNNHKIDLDELIATSSNSGTTSGTESERRTSVLKKNRTNVLSANRSEQTMISSGFKNMEENESLRTTTSSSSGSYAGIQAKDEYSNNIKRDPSAVACTKEETTSSVDVNGMNRHILFDLLSGAAKTTQTKDEKISRGDTIKKDLIEISSDLSSDAQIENARDSRISIGNYENSATVDTIARTESNNRRDQREDSREIISCSSDNSRNDRRDDSIGSTSSANSHAAARATTSVDIAKSEKAEENREATVSALGKAEAYNEVKGTRPNDWLVTTTSGGAATLAEECAQNKNKFNILREVGEVVSYAGTSTGAAAADKIGNERHDVRAEDPSDECQGSPDAMKKIRNAAISRASTRIIVSKEAKNRRNGENILNDETSTSLFDKERAAEVQNEVGRDISHSSSSTDIRETRSSMASMISSASATTVDNTITNISTKYDKINGETSAGSTLDPTSKKVRMVETTSPHPSNKIDRCDNDVETREFMNEASSLYRMLNKQRNSEVLVLKKNPEGPVQVANLRNSVPPLIAYRLIPREMYEKIRTIIANKQIRYANCPLSNT